MKKYFFLSLLVLISLTSCSGGGGEDDGPIVDKNKIELSSSSLSFPATGGTENITISSNTDWIVSIEGSNTSWITVNPMGGNGNGSIRITADANTTADQRSANIIVSKQNIKRTISVIQNGQEFSLSVDQTSMTFNKVGETLSFNITSSGSWSIEKPEWCSINVNAGSGNKTVEVTSTANATGNERTGEIIIKGQGGKEAKILLTQPTCIAPKVEMPTVSDPGAEEVEFQFVVESDLPLTKTAILYYEKGKQNEERTVDLGTETKGKITGLKQQTDYHIRAYAQNAVGESYSTENIFTTKSNVPQSGDNTPPNPNQ